MSRCIQPLTAVNIISRAIPFINCHTLEFLVVFSNLYIKNITIVKSNIKEIILNGF